MKNIFFLEFIRHVSLIDNYIEKDDIIIALSPEVASELDYRKIPYKRLQGDYYSHKEYIEIVPFLEKQLFEILNKLDLKVEKFDSDYKSTKIKPFYRFIYFFKILFDSIRVKIFELDKLFSKEKIKKVKLFKVKSRPIKKFYEYSSNESLYQPIINIMKNKYNYRVKEIEVANDRIKYSIIKEYIIDNLRIIKSIFTKKKKLINNNNKETGSILSVGCREFEIIEDYFASKGWIVNYYYGKNFKKINNKKYSDYFIKQICYDNSVLSCFEFLDINFSHLVKDRIKYFTKSFKAILETYYELEKFMKKNIFDIVFFHTLTPFKYETVLLPFICSKLKIPYVCWMHGGAGANKTLNGYKFSDYIFGQHYFVYGEEYKKLLLDCYSEFKLIPHTIGSPMIVKKYSTRINPKNKKKIVTIVTGPCGNRNKHHLFDSPHYRFDYYFPLKAVIENISKFKDKYRIIIRAQNIKSLRDMLNNLLKSNNAQEIEIMDTKTISFEDVVKLSDLFINFLVSTTFFEECLSKADILLFDNSDLTDETKNTINNRAFWYDNLDDFLKFMVKYLDDGLFYQKSNDKIFLKKYMDWDNREHIGQNTLKIVEEITKMNKS